MKMTLNEFEELLSKSCDQVVALEDQLKQGNERIAKLEQFARRFVNTLNVTRSEMRINHDELKALDAEARALLDPTT